MDSDRKAARQTRQVDQRRELLDLHQSPLAWTLQRAASGDARSWSPLGRSALAGGIHRSHQVAGVVVLAHLPCEQASEVLRGGELRALDDRVWIHVADERAAVEQRVIE